MVVPVVGGHLEGLYLGESAEADRFGLGDPRLRMAMNLYGAPSMTPKEFAAYQQRTFVGVSLTVAPPLGQYDSAKLINIGTHRWSIKPELGSRSALGRWVVEAMAGAWFFTENDDFFGGRTPRAGADRRDPGPPDVQVHAHACGWPGMPTTITGGRTTIDGEENFDLQRNSRVGATFSSALGRGQAIRLSVSRGAFTTIGAAFTSIGASYSYAWVR